jgi:hypothetical protein
MKSYYNAWAAGVAARRANGTLHSSMERECAVLCYAIHFLHAQYMPT